MIIFEIVWIVLSKLDNPDSNILLWIIIFSATFLIHRITLCAFLSKDGRDKNIGAGTIWTVLGFLLGIMVLPVYFIVTRNSKADNPNSKKGKYILIILSVIFLIINLVSFWYCFNTELTDVFNNAVVYENENGEKVLYDKMGNEYQSNQANDILFYDSTGNSYIVATEHSVFGYKCLENGNFYPSSPYDALELDMDYFVFLINESGYVSLKDPLDVTFWNDGIYYDDEGNLYYETYICSWDADGNPVFADNSSASEIKYEDIINYENEY